MGIFDMDREADDGGRAAGERRAALVPARAWSVGPPHADGPWASPLNGVQVVLDPGLGGGSSRGMGWVLSVAHAAAARLRALGARVSLTQEGDGGVPQPVRRLRAWRAHADLVLGLDVAVVGECGEELGPGGHGVRVRYAPWRPWRIGPCRSAAHRLLGELVAAGADDAGVVAGLEGDGCHGVAGALRTVSLLAVFGARWVRAADADAVAVAVARGVVACCGDRRAWRDGAPEPPAAGVRQPAWETIAASRPAASPPPERHTEAAAPGGMHAERLSAAPSWPEEPEDDAPPRTAAVVGGAPPSPATDAASGAGSVAATAGWPDAPPRVEEALPTGGAATAGGLPPDRGPEVARHGPAGSGAGGAVAAGRPEPEVEERVRAWAPEVPPGRAATEPAAAVYDRSSAPREPLSRRPLAQGFVRIERQRPVDDWYRPFMGSGAVCVHIPQDPPSTAGAASMRLLSAPAQPAPRRPPGTRVRVTSSR